MKFNTFPTDASTVAVLRRALDEIIADRRFEAQTSVSALDMAELLLAQAAAGERDIDRLKAAAFRRLKDHRGDGALPTQLSADTTAGFREGPHH